MTANRSAIPLWPNQKITIHTDGAAKGNPGPSGWAFILRLYSEGTLVKQIEKSGYLSASGTNNQTELTAMIEGLKACPSDTPIEATSDSEYVTKNANERLRKWEVNGMRLANNKPVKNQELWGGLSTLLKEKTPTLIWVKGHSGNPLNERADELASAAAYGITSDETTYFDDEGNPISTPTTSQDKQE